MIHRCGPLTRQAIWLRKNNLGIYCVPSAICNSTSIYSPPAFPIAVADALEPTVADPAQVIAIPGENTSLVAAQVQYSAKSARSRNTHRSRRKSLAKRQGTFGRHTFSRQLRWLASLARICFRTRSSESVAAMRPGVGIETQTDGPLANQHDLGDFRDFGALDKS
jgi:hypothetical protein